MSPMKKFDIAIVGELNLDFILYGVSEDIPPERELLVRDFTMTLGSSSAITAHNMAILGSRVAFLSSIGPDPLGEICCRRLEDAGVDITGVRRKTSGKATGASFLLPLLNSSERRILTYAGAMSEMDERDIDEGHAATARHVHLSAFFLHRKLMPYIPRLFEHIKMQGLTTSLDTNDDPADEWGEALHRTLPHVDILLCNEREVQKIAGMENSEAAAEHVAKSVRLLIMKCGREGAYAWSGGEKLHVPGINVSVVDTIGAGDSFNAGFLHKWLQVADIEAALRFGNLAGALSVTRTGGTEAFRDANYVAQFLKQYGHSS